MNNIATNANRGWLRFRLRTLLLAIGVCAVWLAWIVASARQQREAAAWIRSLGRQPKYSYEFDSRKYIPNASPSVPPWLVDHLGIDYFSRVEFVHLDDRPVKSLNLMSHLDGLRHLELCNAQITDLSPLRGLANLELLSVSQNSIHDLSPLSQLTKLKSLYAYKTQVADVEPLRYLTRLENVVLSSTRIADLSPLANHPALKHLDVSMTNVSDISPLKSIKSLVSLDLTRTRVPDSEIDALKAALPACAIAH